MTELKEFLELACWVLGTGVLIAGIILIFNEVRR